MQFETIVTQSQAQNENLEITFLELDSDLLLSGIARRC